MKLTEPEIKVLKHYRILAPNGEVCTSVLALPLSKPLGEGPLIAPDALKQLLGADKTPDKKWLDWIFYQAGGGEKSSQMFAAAMQQIKDRFLRERTQVKGFIHPETKQHIPPISREDAEAVWKQALPQFEDKLAVSDQDTVAKLNTFGYYRHWPGNNRIYELVVNAVTTFQRLVEKVEQMNKERAREGGEVMPTTPETIKSSAQMMEICNKTERYFASKTARSDKRLSSHPARQDGTIYSDDFVEVRVPLTWAAAVEYGYRNWDWANPETFDEVLSNEGWDHRNVWLANAKKGKVYVYIAFHAPVPVWIGRVAGNYKDFSLTNLALELDGANLKNLNLRNVNDLTVWDEENRNTLKISDVKNSILTEPGRVEPNEEEIPIKRGANVYATPEQAKEVVAHLDMALQAIVEWAQTFDPATIKADMMKL